MKEFIKSLLRPIFCNNIGFKIISGLCNLVKFPSIEPAREGEGKFMAIVEGKTVLHGPFKGMKYPKLQSVGSTMYPKILGSYEKEISELIESLCNKPYTTIVDIGCAEGYYAVGFAMRIPSAKVYACDIDSDALSFCQEMAQLNGIAVETMGLCTNKELCELELGTKALIISDCEGYEAYLFNNKLAQKLDKHDFLIETHDLYNIEITQKMYEAFSETHSIKEFESINDILKAYRYHYPELNNFSLGEKCSFLSERRSQPNRWLYMEPK